MRNKIKRNNTVLLGLITALLFLMPSTSLTTNKANLIPTTLFNTGDVKFVGYATTNESIDFPICYNEPHCNITITEIIYDPMNILQDPNVSVCYNKTIVQLVVNLTVGMVVEVYGRYYTTQGPMQYIGHVCALMEPYYVRILNDPPNTPIIRGRTSGKPGTEYAYTFVAVDPEGDDVSYYIDWGDGNSSGWTRYRESGNELSSSHIWDEEGLYTIKAKAKDRYNAEGDWGLLEVTMPKSKPATNMLFKKIIACFPVLARLLER